MTTTAPIYAEPLRPCHVQAVLADRAGGVMSAGRKGDLWRPSCVATGARRSLTARVAALPPVEGDPFTHDPEPAPALLAA